MQERDDSSEISNHETEIDYATRDADAGSSPLIDALFAPQAAAMHCMPVDPAKRGRVGRLREVDETYGHGTYWYFPIDDQMGVAVFDLQFATDVEFTCNTPDFFCFGSYGRNMVPYFGIKEEPSDKTLLGYVWKKQPYRQSARANEQLNVTSIIFLPKAVKHLSLRCHCDPLVLSRAITSLDGTRDVLGLNTVFDEIKRARPSPITAKAYYEAKITEAVTLLLDWSLSCTHDPHASVRIMDHGALNLARTHLRDQVGRTVTTDELCHITCMSASKITRLFKQVEGVTPQEYARTLRMERACELLEESDLSMADISERLGFSRQGSFSEAFKERFGVTPRTFRTIRRTDKRVVQTADGPHARVTRGSTPPPRGAG